MSSLGRLAFVLLLAGCKTDPPPPPAPAPTPSASAAPTASAVVDPNAKPLDFVVDQTFEKQKPLDHAPWHADGGEWTFFDVHLMTSGAKLGLGFESLDESFGAALVTTPSFEESKKIIKAASDQLQVLAPLDTLTPSDLRFTPTTAARSDTHHSVVIRVGQATTTVYVSFNTKEKRGKLEPNPREKPEWNARVISAYFHGPRPERTEATDPQISAEGPKLGGFTSFAPPQSRFFGFFPDAKHVLYSTPNGALLSIAAEEPSKTTELVPAGATIEDAQCSPELCVISSQVDGGTSELSITTRSSKTRRVLKKPVSDINVRFARSAIAPGGAYVAIPTTNKMWFVPTSGGGAAKSVEYQTPCDVVGWTGGRAIVSYLRAGERRPLFDLVSPATGERKPIDDPPIVIRANPTPTYWPRDGIAPDRKQSYACHGDELTFTDLAPRDAKEPKSRGDTPRTDAGASGDGGSDQRRFPIHIDDRLERDPTCTLPWWNARYLSFETSRHGVIDTKTMKLSYLAPADEELGTINDDFTFSVRKKKDGSLEVGRITVPH